MEERLIGWYVTYERATGKVLNSIYCDSNTARNLDNTLYGIIESSTDNVSMLKVDITTDPPTLVLSFDKLKQAKSLQISSDCEIAIMTGFYSSELGTPHLYPAKQYDQLNLASTILRSSLPSAVPGASYLFLCRDNNEAWAFRPHTAAQIQQVGSEAYDAILAARGKHATLQYYIGAATSEAQLNAIHW